MQNEHNPSCRYLGIDIGGTRIKWGVIDAKGTIVRRGLADTCPEKGAEYFLRTLCALVENAGPIEGVGICTAGIVDSHAGTVLGGIENIPFLKGMPLQSLLEQAAGCRARLLNDVNAAALGEHWVGAGMGCRVLFCVTIGTGIGGSLMIDGAIHNGAHFHAGEIGYMRYAGGACLETDYSASGLVRMARAKLNIPGLGPDEFFSMVSAQNAAACEIYRHWLGGLGSALADVLIMLDPEKLIIGGGITERGTLLLEPLRGAILSQLPEEMRSHYDIVLAQCQNSAGMLGAVKNFIQCAAPSV